jgi:hypothetical protein
MALAKLAVMFFAESHKYRYGSAAMERIGNVPLRRIADTKRQASAPAANIRRK